MNNTTCHENYPSFNVSWCPPVFDDFLCWPPIPAGSNMTLGCPQIKGVNKEGKAYRYCREDGHWEAPPRGENREKGYTHYEGCLVPELLEVYKMCDKIQECPQIIRTTRNIEMAGLSLSLISLIISLSIFFRYRVLKNNRTKIHKNLFVATLLQVVFRLIRYIDHELTPENRIIEYTPGLDETCAALLEYTKTAMFMWMFIEGLYLHNMITVTVFQEYSYIKLYFYVGWTAPAIIVVGWVVTMLLAKGNWGYYYFLRYYWILEGPRSVIIVVNLLFLINIIRVLVVKLRESRTSEIEQIRKAVRAAIFLVPLMGIANSFFWFDYRFTEAWKFALWSYTSYFLNTFQGFFIAVLYCFLNGEVQTAVKNSFYLHMSLRNQDYTPCRNLTLISTAPEPEPAIKRNDPPWMCNFLQKTKKSSDDKDINECDPNGRRRTSAIVTSLTMVEAKALTRFVSASPSPGDFPRLPAEETDATIIEDKSSETKV